MAAGDVTITHIGVFPISGAAMMAAGITSITQDQIMSGARLEFVPISNGQQISIYKWVRA